MLQKLSMVQGVKEAVMVQCSLLSLMQGVKEAVIVQCSLLSMCRVCSRL